MAIIFNNKLITEKSPYLLQHARNPVNWYPWGEEAFKKALQENKPIFLSIGYSTCHWCHEMARESFEDEEVAAVLNEHYVSIKVDREERPDIDSVYMKVCQMMTGHGGWPLTVVMTPDRIPFYAGTYFPKVSKHGLPGMMEMLTQLNKKYEQDPDHISEVTRSVQDALEQTKQTTSKNRIGKSFLKETYDQLQHKFDSEYGGFGPAPKFPQPQNLFFLLNYYHFSMEENALKMAEETLHHMVKGGIYDHIGFGFSRYSTDQAWLVPHFEKMLYDNALLLYNFASCYTITKNSFYKKIGENIIKFISREMSTEDGAFYSAIDADSENVEGKYYVWDYEEVFDILGEEIGEAFTDYYGMTPAGNFEGKNIPNLIHHEELSEISIMENVRKMLLNEREKRVYPHVDDKVLSGWNCMMIAALAKAGSTFSNEIYLDMAIAAMQFIEGRLFLDGRLLARYRDGEAKFNAHLDDYAFLNWAYIDLYEATLDLHYLRKAKKQIDEMIRLFWDKEHGGFFQTGTDSEVLISREKEIYDGALPSGNGVAANILLKLSALTGELHYKEIVETMRYSFYEDIHDYSAAAAFFINSLHVEEYPTKEVVIIGKEADPIRIKLLDRMKTAFLPNITVLVAEDPAEFTEIAPFAAEYRQLEGKTTIYVCENFACMEPTTDIEKALNIIIK